ncbi:MaoC/PaaZ C-terminal domain-containing protein [Kineococcus gynurae]|uniref:MaoC/PaaZ C-terminal domain-containing protein n=1 Tax=Kineococcus gynurae TaxID=452979 RepID=A0ABV5LRT7_9ACTN
MVDVADRSPGLAGNYVRALLPARAGRPELPRTVLGADAVRVDPGRFAAHARLCGFPLRDEIPLSFVHLLAFPLQVQLLVRERFPFRVLGLVHLRQEFEQTRPLRAEEPLDLRVRATALRAHAKGTVVDLVATAAPHGSEVVWTGRSSYLARGRRFPGREAPELEPLPVPDGPGQRWTVPAGTGRAFAAVSGDVNPIHLSAATAKLFGFPRALAHGMWTASRSLAALGAAPAGPSRFRVEFRKPLLLPATVEHVVAAAPDGNGWSTAVRSRDGSRLHLVGRAD